tara:strand:+ start:5400 stop:5642 length:243 start_codon:yes stop_codon:yes gene_type:complete
MDVKREAQDETAPSNEKKRTLRRQSHGKSQELITAISYLIADQVKGPYNLAGLNVFFARRLQIARNRVKELYSLSSALND